MNGTNSSGYRTSAQDGAGQRVAVRRRVLTAGAVPQVSLLPAEVREAGSAARHRRRLAMIVGAAVVVASTAVALSAQVASTAQQQLAASNGETTALNAQIAKFSDLQRLQAQIGLGEAAVTVGGSTIVDWAARVRDIESDMPAGYTVTSISASSATPMADYPQGVTPLEPRRAVTLMMTISTGTIGDEYSVWLRNLRSIPAYADATASTTSNQGVSIISLTVHLTADAISPSKPE